MQKKKKYFSTGKVTSFIKHTTHCSATTYTKKKKNTLKLFLCLFFAEWRYLCEKCCWVKVFSLVIKLQKYTYKVATVRQGNAKHWFRTTRRSYGKARAEHWFRTPSPIQSRQSNEGGGALHGEFYGGVVAVNSVSLSNQLTLSISKFPGLGILGIWFSFDLRGRGTTTLFPFIFFFYIDFSFFF